MCGWHRRCGWPPRRALPPRTLGGRMPLAIVTGASRGIGRALALRLAQAGYTVAAVARAESELRSLAAESERILTVPLDLTDGAALDRVIGALLAQHGPCAVLV